MKKTVVSSSIVLAVLMSGLTGCGSESSSAEDTAKVICEYSRDMNMNGIKKHSTQEIANQLSQSQKQVEEFMANRSESQIKKDKEQFQCDSLGSGTSTSDGVKFKIGSQSTQTITLKEIDGKWTLTNMGN